MKKFGWLVLVLLVVAIASTYIFIPSNITIDKLNYTQVKPASIVRCLHDDSKWQYWFPGKAFNGGFSYKNQQYQLKDKKYASQDVLISDDNDKYNSTINIVPLGIDSSLLEWKCQFKISTNPFKRITQYATARKISANLRVLLDSFTLFTNDVKNIYGFDIKYTTLTDTALVSLQATTKQYPSTELIYAMIDTLKNYVKQQQASIHNYPMLNIQLREGGYLVSVGLPTNIPLKGTNSIEPKRMIMIKNKTLVTFVTGDTSIIRKAFDATANYMHDYELAPPVIPFQQMVTDRTKEKDSSKWITRIFSPIM